MDACRMFSDDLTRAALDTRGPKAVLSVWVGYELVKVGVVAHEARAGVLTHPVVLEVPTGLQHKQQSSQFTGTITEPHTNDNTAFLDRSLGKILRSCAEREQMLLLEALPDERLIRTQTSRWY